MSGLASRLDRVSFESPDLESLPCDDIRAAGIVSLFRLLEPGGDDYAAMARKATDLLGAGRD